MMLVKFLTSANQKHWIWSCDESRLCNPRPRLLGDEVVVGPSLMLRKMDPLNVIRNIYCRTRLTKINWQEKWYSVGKITFLIKFAFYQKHLNVWNYNFIWKVPLVGPTQIKNNTEAICEWRLYCGKYVMNRTDLQLVCYSKFCNQYIASMNYPYKAFRRFFLALYSTQISYCFC